MLHRTILLRWTGLFRAAYRRYRSREAVVDQVRPVEVLMGAALLTRRDIFRKSGGWDEEFRFGGEDIDLCTRIGRSRAVVYHPGIDIVHYGRAGSRQRHQLRLRADDHRRRAGDAQGRRFFDGSGTVQARFHAG